jgi:hypothetical protein
MTQTVETFVKAAEQALAFGRGNVEAMLRSGQILAAGTQDLSKQMLSLTEASLKLIEQSTAPITARVSEAVETVRPAA